MRREINDTAPKAKSRVPILGVVAVVAVTVAASMTGFSGAYLVDKESKVNDITMGNIYTELTEPEWDKNTIEDRTVWPGKVVSKDPTVTNLQESTSPCFAYLVVTTPKEVVRVYDDAGAIANDGTAVETELFTYQINDGWTELEDYQVNKADYITRVFAYDTELAPGESTVPLFDSVQYATVIEGDITQGTALNIPVQMVTIQSEYLADGEGNVADTPQKAYDVYANLA